MEEKINIIPIFSVNPS